MNGDNVAADELLGVTIAGRYRIISRLGAGGMGVAYRAWDEQGGLPVVIKIPKRSFLDDPKFAERFYREIRLLQGLEHPHIVPIVDVGDHDGLPFVVMRFLPGGSLSNRRLRDEQGKPRPNAPAMLHLWLPAIAEALDYVHSQGVVHRDVKPANIFFDAFWGAYLGDFGIAKIVEESDSFDKEHTLTATHMGIGTQEYMAPEQFTPKAVIDGKADQYALAVMVYEMLAGKRPFTGETENIVVEVKTFPVPPLLARRRDVSPAVVQAVHRALAKQPAERFATCREFAAAVLQDVPPMTDEPGVARLLCPQCSNILKLPTTAAGEKGKCPKCQTQMKVAGDLGALWLLDEARKQRKASGGGGDASPSTPGDGIDEKALETFEPVSSETPIGKTTRLPPPPPVLAVGTSLAAIALLGLAIGMFGGKPEKKKLPQMPKPYEVRLAEALKTLEQNAHDLDANDFVARHYCFKERDWKKGLPYLEKSRMSEAAALAKEEINANDANPVMPGTLVRLARKWWDYGGRTALNTPQSAAATRMHAKDIYIEHIRGLTDQSDVDWANQWLDGDKDFAQLVKNLRLYKEIFLSEIPEGETKVVHFGFGKGTVNGTPIRSIIDGRPSPHGLAMHPGDGPDDQCFAKYKLPAGCKRFTAIVTLDQSGSFAHCGIGFEVIADGRSVWKSQTIDKGHQSESCDIPITGCRNLELRTCTVSAAFGGHAVWIEPRIAVDSHDKRTTDETQALAPDKAVAEWVLQRGGSVEIEMADRSRKRLATIDDLTRLLNNHEGPVVKAEQRLRWQNEKNIDSRLVYHVNEKIWREEDSKGNFVFSFVERSRTPEYVELFDDSRKVVLRVYPDRVMYSDAGGSAFELWRGAWVASPGEAGPFAVLGIELTAKQNVTDQGLACVAGLHRLEWLGVGGTAVTDALFDHLRSLPNLRGIGVNWTSVSGHGLATLADAQLKHLEISGMKDPEVAVAYLHKKGVAEWINFDGMKMTRECVRLLGEMKTLKALHFRSGLITEEQVETLKKQLPACHFHIWK